MLNKWLRKLLLGVAKALTYSANALENLLVKDNSLHADIVLTHSNDGPPAHWLEKVRQGAPHLLNTAQESDEQDNLPNQPLTTNTYPVESFLAEPGPLYANVDLKGSNDLPPAHWLAKVRQGAPGLLNPAQEPDGQDTLPKQPLTSGAYNLKSFLAEPGAFYANVDFKSSNDEAPAHWLAKVRQAAPHLLNSTQESDEQNPLLVLKQKSEVNKSPVPTPLLRVKSKKFFEPLIKSIKHVFPAITPFSKKTVSGADSLLQKQAMETERHFSNNVSALAGLNHKIPAVPVMALNQVNQQNLPVNEPARNNLNVLRPIPAGEGVKHSSYFMPVPKRPKMAAAVSNNRKYQSKTHAGIAPGLDENQTEHEKKSPHQSASSSVKKSLAGRAAIHFYPNSQIPTKTSGRAPDIRINAPKKSTAQVSTPKDQMAKFPGVKPQQDVKSVINKTAEFLLADTLKKDTRKHTIANNNKASTITGSIILDSAAKTATPQHRMSGSYPSEPFQSGFSRWPNLPEEMTMAVNQDRWPPLPESEGVNSKETGYNAIKFRQLQEDTKRKFLSEQEQRGKLWNG